MVGIFVVVDQHRAHGSEQTGDRRKRAFEEFIQARRVIQRSGEMCRELRAQIRSVLFKRRILHSAGDYVRSAAYLQRAAARLQLFWYTPLNFFNKRTNSGQKTRNWAQTRLCSINEG